MTVCPKCGLPKEICSCKEIIKESQRVSISVTSRKWGKPVTIIKGFNWKELGQKGLKEFVRYLKKKLACGGVYDKDNNWIELQGEHKERVKPYLRVKGFKIEGDDSSEAPKTGKA